MIQLVEKLKVLILKNRKLFVLGMIVKIIFTVSLFSYAQSENRNTGEIKIHTSAVCGMCKERIEKGLAFEKGVKDVNLDIPTKIVTVTYKPKKTNPEKIRLAISNLGYDADEVPANVKAYEKLPTCCKKDAPPH